MKYTVPAILTIVIAAAAVIVVLLIDKSNAKKDSTNEVDYSSYNNWLNSEATTADANADAALAGEPVTDVPVEDIA